MHVTIAAHFCQNLPRLLQLNLLVILWSLTGILGDMVSLSSAPLVFWRTLLAATCFIAFAFRKKASLSSISRRHLAFSLLAGSLLGIHWIFFFAAIAVSNISVGLAGLAATSLFTALLKPLSHHTPPNRKEILFSLIAVAGLLIIVGARTKVPNAHLGIIYGLLAATLSASYSLVAERSINEGLPGPTMMMIQMTMACLTVFLSIFLLPTFSFQFPSFEDWPILAFLAIACTFFAFLWYARLLQHFSAYSINLSINLEPVYGMLLASLLFHEHQSLTLLFYLGTFLIVLANFLNTTRKNLDNKTEALSS